MHEADISYICIEATSSKNILDPSIHQKAPVMLIPERIHGQSRLVDVAQVVLQRFVVRWEYLFNLKKKTYPKAFLIKADKIINIILLKPNFDISFKAMIVWWRNWKSIVREREETIHLLWSNSWNSLKFIFFMKVGKLTSILIQFAHPWKDLSM